MVLALSALCAAYIGVVIFVRRSTRAGRAAAAQPADLPPLPDEDLPPLTAVGWPPDGDGLPAYVEVGFAALDAYLSEGFAP
jgi:hypothetical protein